MREADSLLKQGGLSIDSTCVPHFLGRSERWSLSHHGAAARGGIGGMNVSLREREREAPMLLVVIAPSGERVQRVPKPHTSC